MGLSSSYPPSVSRQHRVPASLPPDESIRWRLRLAILIASTTVLLVLLAAWWVARSYTLPKESPLRISVFDRDLELFDLGSEPTAEQLLQLGERESQRLVEQFPESAAAHCVAANRFYLLGNISGARAAWQRALEVQSLYPEAIFGLALLAFELGEYEETVELGELLGTFELHNPRTPLLLADAYRNLNRNEQAILVLEQHVASEQSSVQAWEMLGSAHLSDGNLSKAIQCFSRVLEFAPDSKDAHYGLGQAYARSGEANKSKQHLSRFQEVARVTSETHRSDAQSFRDRNHAASVLAQVLFGVSQVLKQAGDLEAAETKALQALMLQPDVVEWLRELQRIVQANGKLWEAIDVGEKIVALDGRDVAQWLNLGTLYAEVQQVDQAIAAFQQAISIDPADPRCQQAQVTIRRLRVR